MRPLLLFLIGFISLKISAAEINWVLESKAAWQARDSQAEWVFKDQL